MSRPPMIVALWEFPREDFADWLALVGAPPGGFGAVRDYEGYLRLLDATAVQAEAAGMRVARKRFSVARMREELAARGLPNDPASRAVVTARIELVDS